MEPNSKTSRLLSRPDWTEKLGLSSFGVLIREERQNSGHEDEEKQSLLSVGPSTWDLITRPRLARLARKTASTPSSPALTQVGRAPSLTLEALTSNSSRENLTLWGLALRAGRECPETSPGPGRAKLGKRRQALWARGRVRLGPAERKPAPWALTPGGRPRAVSPSPWHCVRPPGASACLVRSFHSGQAC